MGVGRQAVRLGLVGALGVLLWAMGVGTAGASCAGPHLSMAPVRAAPGDAVMVAGTGFGTECHDTGQPGPPLGPPARGIELYAAQGDDVVLLARVDANADYWFSVRVTVPPTFEPGPAGVRLTRATQRGTFTTFEVSAPTQPVSATTTPPLTGSGPITDTFDRGGGQSPVVPFVLGLTAAAVIAAGVGAVRSIGSPLD